MLSGFELYPRWVPLIAVLARKCHRHDCQCQRGECMGSSSPPPWSVSLAVFLLTPWTSLSLTEKPLTTSVQ